MAYSLMISCLMIGYSLSYRRKKMCACVCEAYFDQLYRKPNFLSSLVDEFASLHANVLFR